MFCALAALWIAYTATFYDIRADEEFHIPSAVEEAERAIPKTLARKIPSSQPDQPSDPFLEEPGGVVPASAEEIEIDDTSSAELTNPDEVFDPQAHPEAIRKIDGAWEADDDDDDDWSEWKEEDPLDGGSLRWMMRVDEFGITDWELGTVDHRPRFADHTRCIIDIPFAIHFIDEVQALGLPSELYDARIQFRIVQPVGEVWGLDLAAVPSFFSDFDSGSNNGFRMTGHGMLTLMHSEQWQFALGAAYLGREDVPVLPVGGVVWNIADGTRLELLMPKPRIWQRVWDGETCDQYLYTGFELWGGNSWDITRPDDTFDTFTYRDFRFFVGSETRRDDSGVRGVFEVGYVFARKLEFRRDPTTLEPGDTLMLRIGSNY